ncbi:MAG TPA: iron-sulfur cluster repair di-iron protein [Bacteroidales bacterium]|nr:iron-sulfur cluster repair di-iron protein [Bacteroidales bacterium]
METMLNTKVSDLVRKNYRTAEIFHQYHIDFCCNGDKTLEEACRERQVSLDKIQIELERLMTQEDDFSNKVNSMSLTELVDYIIERHHSYVRNNIPMLQEFLTRISQVHGERHPELHEVKSLFDETAGNLVMHMQKEEIILFPYIKKMEDAAKRGVEKIRSPFGEVSNPIRAMEAEHQAEGERFERIASLTQHYTIPADACNTYRVSLQKLEEFEKDLHTHIHLENNILFPKAIELEKNL